MTSDIIWYNQTGGLSNGEWGAIGSGFSAVANGVAGYFENRATNKSLQSIANGKSQNNIYISNLNNQTNQQIAQGNNATQGQVANIAAEAEIQVAKINAAALAAQKQPISSSTVSFIFVGVILVVSVVGIFYMGNK